MLVGSLEQAEGGAVHFGLSIQIGAIEEPVLVALKEFRDEARDW